MRDPHRELWGMAFMTIVLWLSKARGGSALMGKNLASDASSWVTGDVIVVGASRRNGHGGVYAFKYDAQSATWFEEDILVHGASGSIEFGSAISLHDDILVVGAHFEAAGAGRAYVYQRQSAGWVFIQTLSAIDAAPNDEFGWSIRAGPG